MRAVLVVLICGCFSPDIGEGALVCGDGMLCPEGFHCAGNHCYQNPPAIDAPVDGICSPGDFIRCDGTMNLVRCAVGGGEETITCDFGCNPPVGKCNVCEPNQRVCDGAGRLITCSSDGQMQNRMTCPSTGNECTVSSCINNDCMIMNLGDGMTCSSGVCVGGACHCGDMGEPCCTSNRCNGTLMCMSGHCGNCGAPMQSCCGGTTCSAGAVCSANTCAACGAATQPCCTGQSCDLGSVCAGSTCRACGDANLPCCTVGAQCTGNLTCVTGTCQCVPTCAGKACGADDGCGSPCPTGSCDTGLHCIAGMCRCDSQSCSMGCCSNDTCLPGNTTQDCGSGGNQCQQCMGLALCVGQVCQL